MAKYVFVYQGGSMPNEEAERQQAMQAWQAWFERLGTRLVDGGNPVGASKSVSADGTVGAAKSQLSGYSIIVADSLDGAVADAKDCPVLRGGASIDVYEAIDVMAAMNAR